MERSTRRRGYSRRVQYGLFAGYVIAVAGVVAALLLLLLQRLQPAAFAAVESTVLDVTAPVTGAGRAVVRGAGDLEADVAAYLAAASQNRALRAELAQARRRLIRARIVEAENSRLRAVARLRREQPRIVAAARIVGSTATGQRRFATLAAGWADGVRAGMPVRSGDGLVGIVEQAGRGAARVLLLTDGGSTVPIRVLRNGQPALATGRGDGLLELKAIVGGGVPFRKGDLVVTSGTGGVYAPNIPVALVTQVDRDIATAVPLAHPARLDFALVEPVAQPLLPPPPPPVP